MNRTLWIGVCLLALPLAGFGAEPAHKMLPVAPAVQNEKLVYGPPPAYPPAAKATRLSGAVRLLAIIGTDGAVRSLQVLNGHPLLAQAAVKTVSSWKYEPTLRDGAPVEVVTQIGVQFSPDGKSALVPRGAPRNHAN